MWIIIVVAVKSMGEISSCINKQCEREKEYMDREGISRWAHRTWVEWVRGR